MVVAALVHPDRLDKSSLLLTGQPEKEVRECSCLILTVDEMKYMLASLLLAFEYENCLISVTVRPANHVFTFKILRWNYPVYSNFLCRGLLS